MDLFFRIVFLVKHPKTTVFGNRRPAGWFAEKAYFLYVIVWNQFDVWWSYTHYLGSSFWGEVYHFYKAKHRLSNHKNYFFLNWQKKITRCEEYDRKDLTLNFTNRIVVILWNYLRSRGESPFEFFFLYIIANRISKRIYFRERPL